MLALFFLAALLADANSATALLKRGLLALENGDVTGARAALEEASREDPRNAVAWVSLAQVYLRSGDARAAADAAKKAAANGTRNGAVEHALALYYAEANDPKQAIDFAQAAERDAPGPKNEDLLGRLLAADGHGAEAEKHLGAAWEGARTDPRITFDYVQVLLPRGDFTRAADVLDVAMRAQPRDAQLVLALGVARYGQRRFDDAIAQFLKVIEIDPRIEQPYVFLGKMLEQAGPRLPEITRVLLDWSAQEPENARAKLLVAKALLAANRRDERAEPLLRESLKLDANDWEAHYELGVALENRHAYADAAAELDRAVQLDPKQAMAHYHLARVYDRLGQAERAQAEREEHARLTAGGGGSDR